jgi:hypothetical protein
MTAGDSVWRAVLDHAYALGGQTGLAPVRRTLTALAVTFPDLDDEQAAGRLEQFSVGRLIAALLAALPRPGGGR